MGELVSQFEVWSGLLTQLLVAAAICTIGIAVGLRAWLRGRIPYTKPLSVAKERNALGLALFIAFVCRFPWDEATYRVTFWFTALPALVIPERLAQHSFFELWRPLLHHTQVDYTHESAVLLPVNAMLLAIFGASPDFPAVAGALWGTAVVGAAWLLIRTTVSREAGLCTAFVLAGSPLQIIWGEVGDYYITSLFQILVAAALAYAAGKRGDLRLAALSAVTAWLGVYLYYSSRTSFVLTPLFLFLGAFVPPRRGAKKLGLLLAVYAAVFLTLYSLTVMRSPWDALWPRYAGYLGWRSEQGWNETFTIAEREFWRTLEIMFVRFRLFFTGIAREDVQVHWGAQSGGLMLLPVTCLALIGLVWSFRERHRALVLLVLAAVGLFIPMMSITTPRRLLILETALNAYAGLGLLVIVRLLHQTFSRNFTAVVVGGAGCLYYLWTLGTLSLLHRISAQRVISDESRVNDIPFGQGWVGDGVTCYRCQEVARLWQRDVADASFVLLFDSDLAREDYASPAGLFDFGRLAMVPVEGTHALHDFYRVHENSRRGPYFGEYFRAPDTPLSYLRKEYALSKASRAVFHFERPTQ